MTAKTNAAASNTDKPKAAYLVQRENRKRFSFGSVWTEAVKEGNVSDKDKLIAHAVKLKVGSKSNLAKLKLETLLAKVQSKLSA